MHGRVLPAERAELGFGANSQGPPGTEYKPLDPIWSITVSECAHAPSQGWDCPPPTSVPRPGPRSNSWSMDQHQEPGRARLRSEQGSRVSGAKLNKAHAQSAPDAEKPELSEAKGPGKNLGHSLSPHRPCPRGLICRQTRRPIGLSQRLTDPPWTGSIRDEGNLVALPGVSNPPLDLNENVLINIC